MRDMKDVVAIVGMGCSKFGERWDRGLQDLIAEAAVEAYDDAGVGPDDIQCCYFSNGTLTAQAASQCADALMLKNIPILRNENYCCSGHVALFNAWLAVASGAFDVVMVVGAEKLKDTGFPGLGTGRGITPVREARSTAPGSFSQIACRYFNEYGLSYEEGRRMLAKIAVKNHSNGVLTPKAHFHKSITVEDVMKAPIIATPFSLYDCCGNSDGAACAILVSAERARKYRDDPIYIKGFGIAMDAMLPQYRPGFNWLDFDSLKVSSKKAYDMAGIRNPREELDMAEVHDCFTATEMIIYENFGFTGRGGAIKDIADGFFERTGGLPVNVDGGLKCFGHPVGASGIRMTYECYKQLQHKVDNPDRQLKKCDLALSHTFGGGPQISSVLITGNYLG